jgi:hypothetical protein
MMRNRDIGHRWAARMWGSMWEWLVTAGCWSYLRREA